MDIHKPKPWHGLREFLKEYAIIVVGVLTALAAEQAVEWLHVRTEVAEAREALSQEIGKNVGHLSFAAEEDRCFLASMDNYIVWAKGGPKPAPAVDAVKLPPFESSVWDIARAGAVAHMPLKARLAYSNFYSEGANQLSLVMAERALAGRIARFAYLDSLLPQEARELFQEARGSGVFLRIKIGQDRAMLQEAHDLGVDPKPRSAVAQGYLETLCRLAGAPGPATDR
jgi:hypothetical protein